MKVLITGSNGLLGQKLVTYCLHNEINFVATSKGDNRNPDCPESNYAHLDIAEKEAVLKVFELVKPTHVIHTAAITNVDQCELEPDLCKKVNIDATKFLVDAASKYKAHFQLLSTDFVFDGEKGNYSEEDEIHPLSVYAKSKAEGEKIVRAYSYDWSIVRTIIVYGVGNNLSRSNLIVWAKGAIEKGDDINIIDDQYRAPTYADDLAWACMKIIENDKTGIFHISGPETMSIYQIVERIAKFYNYPMENVHKISTATLNQPAKRPPKTGFDLSKAKEQIKYAPHTLEETLPLIFND